MRQGASLVVAIAVAALLGGSLSAVAESMPDLLYSTDLSSTLPCWVSAKAAIGADGRLQESYFSPEAQSLIRDLLIQPALEGRVIAPVQYEDEINSPDRSTLPRALAAAPLAVFGIVIDRAYGFRDWTPGQLLKIKPDQVFAREGDPLGVYYVFLPRGCFQVLDRQICNEARQSVDPPEIGDTVLALATRRVDGSNPYVEIGFEGGFIRFRSDKSAVLPRNYESDQGELPQVSLSELLNLAEQSFIGGIP